MQEFPRLADNKHIRLMEMNQQLEYLDLYANDFEDWKKEHRY